MKMFGMGDKEKLKVLLREEHNPEKLKEFIAKCIGESILITLAMNKFDGKDGDRKEMIEMIKELQAISTNRLGEIITGGEKDER